MNHMNSSSRSFSWNGNSCLFSVSPFIFHSSWGLFLQWKGRCFDIGEWKAGNFVFEKKKSFPP